MPTGFWWGNLKERYYLEELGQDRWVLLKWNFQEQDGRARAELLPVDTNS